MAADQPQFAVINAHISLGDGDLAIPNRLDLCSCQHDAGLELFLDEVIVKRAPAARKTVDRRPAPLAADFVAHDDAHQGGIGLPPFENRLRPLAEGRLDVPFGDGIEGFMRIEEVFRIG